MQRKKSKKSMIIDALTRMRFISQEESSVFLVVFVLSQVLTKIIAIFSIKELSAINLNVFICYTDAS